MLLERGVHGFEGRTAAKPYGVVRALSRERVRIYVSFIYESICLFMGALSLVKMLRQRSCWTQPCSRRAGCSCVRSSSFVVCFSHLGSRAQRQAQRISARPTCALALRHHLRTMKYSSHYMDRCMHMCM